MQLKTIQIAILFFALISPAIAWAQNNADNPLNKIIELKRTEGQPLQFLQDMEQIDGIDFSYNESILPKNTIQIDAKKTSVENYLEQIFNETDIKFRVIGKLIVIYSENKDNNGTINGKIKSAQDGEYLPNATIYIKELKTGVTANRYGFYSITVPRGSYTFIYSFVGFHSYEKTLDVNGNETINIELQENVEQLEEVVILSKKDNEQIVSSQMSNHNLKIQQIRSIPTLGGEADVLKSIQFLPGIQSANEGTTGFSVRGGSYDQNLILLDEAPVYNPAHSVGLFSVFNPDVIKDIQVYKGGIPARYGGRLSSVVDIKMKEGNEKKFSMAGSIGAVSSRLTLESPIGKKVTFLLSGRYGYVGQTAGNLAKWVNIESYDQNAEVNFYDLNAKVGFKLSDKDRIYLSAYAGSDHFKNDIVFADNTLDWGNQTATFRWNRSFGPKLFANLTLIHSDFDYDYIENHDIRNYKWMADFKQNGAKVDFDYFMSPRHELNFGLSITDHDFAPGSITPNDENSLIQPFELENKNALESAFYISHEYHVTDQWLLNYGVRISDLRNIGAGTKYFFDEDGETLIGTETFAKGELMNQYFRWAPRLSTTFRFNDSNSLKASYNKTYQYLHLVSNSSVGLPTDVWLPVDNNIKPRSADQVALGYFKNVRDDKMSISVEAYYKQFDNVIDYKNNAELFLNNNIETQIKTGTGKAYGVELLAEKKSGRLTGWISYTLSKVTHDIEEINGGKTYSPRYDKRHNLSLVASYDLTKKWSLSGNFSYISGGGITVPLGFYNSAGRAYNYYSERNAYQLPAFHQLDLAATYKRKVTGKWQDEITVGITNVYNRKNNFSLYVEHQENARSRVLKSYLFGLMPSVNYSFKF